MNCTVRADLGTCSALLALGFIYVRDMILIERNCAETTSVLAAVSKTAAASVGYFVATHRTFVACDVDYFDNVGIGFVPAHGKLHSLGKNGAFFINATAHRGYFSGNNNLGNVNCVFGKRVVPSFSCNFTQYFVFQMLNFCIEFSHNSNP